MVGAARRDGDPARLVLAWQRFDSLQKIVSHVWDWERQFPWP